MQTLENELNKRSIPFRKFLTKEEKHAIALARELSNSGSTDIIAVGGDGTINEVLNGITPETVNFGIVPAGTGNDFISCCNIPKDPIKALELILAGNPKPTDYMDCSGVRGINIIGTGIDVEILKRCRKFKILKGKIQYLISLLISLIKFRFYEFEILRNDKKENKEALIVCVGNGQMFGGGIRMCPEAKIDDGYMDFVTCTKMKKIKIPNAFVKLMKGKILEQPFTEFTHETEVEVKFNKKTTINVDGELYDDLPFHVKLIRGGVKLYRP